ncbi:MAG TPA: hypothetical protein VM324_15240 [Egibacteraceae bacterium]|nr:hypothetical protein [Egibacteraceae bacterium]
MGQQDPLAKTDYSNHTDDELREAITKADREEGRLTDESSGEAVEAARRQQEEMRAELERRSDG